jgi:MFS family permease
MRGRLHRMIKTLFRTRYSMIDGTYLNNAGDAERLQPHHIGLAAMLIFVAMFEGYDVSLTAVVLPYAEKTFRAGTAMIGNALAVIAMGSIAAWLVVRLADRYGRRPILLAASTGFGLTSLATILVPNLAAYVVIQFVGRCLMVTEIAIAYVVLSESLPAQSRGRVNGIFGSFGSFGAALPFFLIKPALGTALGWKLLFVVGAAPLLAVPFLLVWLRETPAFLRAQQAKVPRLTPGGELRELTSPGLRKRFAAMASLWFIINFASASAGLFFTLYAVHERHWAPTDFLHIAPAVMAGVFSGNIITGFLMDLLGRRLTITIMLVALGCLTQIGYTATGWWTVAASWVGIQSAMGMWAAAFTMTAELFPTHLRGAANGWCNSLVGRWGFVIAPAIIGALSRGTGSISSAVFMLGFVAYLGVPIVWLFIPETRAAQLAKTP